MGGYGGGGGGGERGGDRDVFESGAGAGEPGMSMYAGAGAYGDFGAGLADGAGAAARGSAEARSFAVRSRANAMPDFGGSQAVPSSLVTIFERGEGRSRAPSRCSASARPTAAGRPARGARERRRRPRRRRARRRRRRRRRRAARTRPANESKSVRFDDGSPRREPPLGANSGADRRGEPRGRRARARRPRGGRRGRRRGRRGRRGRRRGRRGRRADAARANEAMKDGEYPPGHEVLLDGDSGQLLYVVERFLAHGAFGEVYAVRAPDDGARHAMKRVRYAKPRRRRAPTPSSRCAARRRSCSRCPRTRT